MPNSTAEVLTPTLHRKENAAILGRGLLHLRDACGIVLAACDSTPESAEQKARDVSAPGDPHVSWFTLLAARPVAYELFSPRCQGDPAVSI